MRSPCQENRVLKVCTMLLLTTMVIMSVLFMMAPGEVVLENRPDFIRSPQKKLTAHVIDSQKEIDDAIDNRDSTSVESVADNAKQTTDGTVDLKGGNVVKFFKQLDDLIRGDEKAVNKGLKLCEQFYAKFKKNPDFMWRFVRALFKKSKNEGAKARLDSQRTISYQAKTRGEEALKLSNDNGDIFKWYTLALGNTVEYESLQNQIKLGIEFKHNLEKAIKLKPKDPALYYMLGRWCYKVYMLSWFERKAAALIYPEIGNVKLDDALNNFLKSDSLRNKQGMNNDDGKLKDNYLFTAKSYIEKGDKKTALAYLKKANALPNKSHDDEVSQKAVKTLMSGL